jgi:hypothetical protein
MWVGFTTLQQIVMIIISEVSSKLLVMDLSPSSVVLALYTRYVHLQTLNPQPHHCYSVSTTSPPCATGTIN